MSAFNTVRIQARCPVCGEEGPFDVQFKYGDTWQHIYKLGEDLKWGGNDIGVKGIKAVRVEGIGGPCKKCKANDIEFDIFVECNRISRVVPLGLQRGNALADGYEVLIP